jgi:hypothetical protein
MPFDRSAAERGRHIAVIEAPSAIPRQISVMNFSEDESDIAGSHFDW